MALTEAEEALAAAEIALTEVKEFMVADSVAGNVVLNLSISVFNLNPEQDLD